MLQDPSHAGVLGGLTSLRSTDGKYHLYFAIANGSSRPLPGNGAPSDQRYNLTLHRSSNGGRQWDSHLIWKGYSGYTAMAPLDRLGSAVAVLWETGAGGGCDLACGLSFGVVRAMTSGSIGWDGSSF